MNKCDDFQQSIITWEWDQGTMTLHRITVRVIQWNSSIIFNIIVSVLISETMIGVYYIKIKLKNFWSFSFNSYRKRISLSDFDSAYIYLQMHFITILISMIGCGTAFECNFCDRTPFSVECKGEIVCPLDAQYVKVQCEIEKNYIQWYNSTINDRRTRLPTSWTLCTFLLWK